MTSEKMLELLNEYISKMEKEERDLIEAVTKSGNFDIKACFPAAALAELKRGLLENIRIESAKSAGRLSALKAAKRIEKSAQEWKREERKTCWIGADGRQYICSGYHMVALNSPLDLETGNARPDVEKNLKMCENGENGYTKALELPSIAELKAHIKTEKANPEHNKKHPVSFDFGLSLPMVNAQYLVDILECLPDCTCTINEQKGYASMLVFSSESGAGVLCPVRKP